MKHPLTIELRLRRDHSPEWCLAMQIDQEGIDGVAREAAGVGGGANWRMVEHFVRVGVRDALLSWAEKTLPQVARIRAHRDLTYAALGRGEVGHHLAEARIENYATRELAPEREDLTAAFAKFVFDNFGGYWVRGERATHTRLPAEVEAQVQKLADAHNRKLDGDRLARLKAER